MADKVYKNKVLFARLSKKGDHIYAFNNDNILGAEYESLILNVSDVKALLEGKYESIKVSAMEVKKDE